MKKLMLVVAMLAVVLVAAAPAIAQVAQGFGEKRITSGPATPKVEIKNAGNNVNECGPTQQIAQTGNVANEQGVTQYDTTTDDISFDGSSINVGTSDAPATVDSVCTQTTEQAAAAG
jgi:hypothetical protein